MSQASQLSPELARGVLQLARALMAASRNCTLYPPEHPAVGQSLARLSEAVRETSNGGVFSIGITPDTLLIETAPADRNQPAIAEAAAFLHDRDLLRITFVGGTTVEALQALLRMFTLDAAERRRRGGPAQIWVSDGDPSIVLEQVDYALLLQRAEGDGPASTPRRADDVWRSIVLAISTGAVAPLTSCPSSACWRIAGDTFEIAGLATAAVMALQVRDGRLADDHVAGGHGARRLPPPDEHRVGLCRPIGCPR